MPARHSPRLWAPWEEILKRFARAFIASALGVTVVPVQAALIVPPPAHIGGCTITAIKSVETRLTDGSTGKPIPGSGSAVSFTNGGYQVSYDTVPAIDNSKPGDQVRMCLVSVPKGCPAGDDRGRVYRTTNLRTHQTWVLPDSEHSCGGA